MSTGRKKELRADVRETSGLLCFETGKEHVA
jgi:hypothetical protein